MVSGTDDDAGQALAVGWSDGVVRLVGLENSKAVHNIHVADGGSADVLYIAWARNWTGQTRTRSRSKRPRGAAHHLLPATTDLDDRSDVLDLPHELTFLEIDTALPKLSPLPVSGGSGYGNLYSGPVGLKADPLTLPGTISLSSRPGHRSSSCFALSTRKTRIRSTS